MLSLRLKQEKSSMKILLSYLRPYKGLIALTLTLAAINTIFSLIDPILFGRIIKLAQDASDKQDKVICGAFFGYFSYPWVQP
jgi:ATP-binding cassette subfamily B protein